MQLQLKRLERFLMTKRFCSSTALGEQLLERLKESPYYTPKTRTNDETIQGLICDKCGDPTAWAYLANPFSINCNRGKCGARTKTLELFPELRRNIERDYPPTKEDPNRPAREYLRSRGLPDFSFKGLSFRYLKDVRKTGSGAVMFTVGKDEHDKDVLNGRLFNPPPGQGKTHNIGSTTGRHWQHPGVNYDPNQKTYITEGILDALSLLAIGQQAVAVLASGQDPGKVDLSFFKNKVLSFDNDEAGHQACRKWKKAYPEAAVILCDSGQDWNDFLTSGNLEQIKEQFEKYLPRFRNNGELALAETAQKWADIFHGFYGYAPGLFQFKKETYFAALKAPRGGDQPAFIAVTCCLRAIVNVTSYTLNRSNPARPEYLYNLEIRPSQPGRRPIAITGSGKDIATGRALNEFLLSSAKIPWEGDAKAATAMQLKITSDKKAPEVQLLPVVGYQPEVNAYVFHKWAVDQAGLVVTPDKRGHFSLGHNRIFQAPSHAEGKSITPATITRQRIQETYHLIRAAWGENGAVALAWTVAGWFVNQVKQEINLFPFLSLYGDPASGKSALVTFLNAIQGREGEGLPITQLSTKKGNIRTIGQVSGLFTALLEDSERNDRAFDYSILLTAYNRGPLQVQAAFSNDLQTRENPFLGSLLFVQNVEPFNSKQERQRVISLQFKADAITDTTRAAYEQLTITDKHELAGIMREILANRPHFEQSWRQAYKSATATLGPLSERRILDNHSLILGFHRLFCDCFGIKEDRATVNHFAHLARQKCLSSAVRQTTLADHFFELIDTLNPEQAESCYHFDPAKMLIYVNLPRAEYILRDIRKMSFQVNEHLTTALQKHPSYLQNSVIFRFPHAPKSENEGRPKRSRVWLFDAEWHKNNRIEAESIQGE
jgi:hypothetical protein